jgi:hypothetical protein
MDSLPPDERQAARANRRHRAAALFDHLVGDCQQRGRHGNAERFGGLKIDNKGKLARLLDRKIAGLRTPSGRCRPSGLGM